MRVIVCGGRNLESRKAVFRALDRFHAATPITYVIHGAGGETDFAAGEWAKQRGVPCTAYPADWKQHGKPAGPIRNRQMLAEGKPETVIAFPGGRGTDDMCRAARARGVPVIELGVEP